jgi:hypothetical protein
VVVAQKVMRSLYENASNIIHIGSRNLGHHSSLVIYSDEELKFNRYNCRPHSF